MSESETGEKLYTLTEVSNKINISMPTLQRYKKLYQDRIPSQGGGRSQRYPEEALEVFLQLKKENMGKRGRPRKNASAGDRPKAPARKKPSEKKSKEGLLTLTQISEMTGISYPTALRYVKSHLAEIPHRGAGRGRRFLPEAVEVFQTLRNSSRRGRKRQTPSAAVASSSAGPAASPAGSERGAAAIEKLTERIRALEKSQRQLEKLIEKQQKMMERPIKVVLQRGK